MNAIWESRGMSEKMQQRSEQVEDFWKNSYA